MSEVSTIVEMKVPIAAFGHYSQLHVKYDGAKKPHTGITTYRRESQWKFR